MEVEANKERFDAACEAANLLGNVDGEFKRLLFTLYYSEREPCNQTAAAQICADLRAFTPEPEVSGAA